MPLFNSLEAQSFSPASGDTWGDFDLSKIVPEGATGAVFHLINTSAGQERRVGLRMKGSTDHYVQDMNRFTHSWAMVGLDENLKCQGYLEALGTQHFLLVGFTGEYCSFFSNGKDITPELQNNWVDTDLSAYCPGAIAAIVELNPGVNARVIWGLRKHGSTDDRHSSNGHCWAVVGLDENQHLDAWYQTYFGRPSVFNLIGYITAGATFYTNANDISPVADGFYKTVSLSGYLEHPVVAFIEQVSGAIAQDWAIRKNAFVSDWYYDGDSHNFAIPHPDTQSATIQVKLENATIRLFLLGIG